MTKYSCLAYLTQLILLSLSDSLDERQFTIEQKAKAVSLAQNIFGSCPTSELISLVYAGDSYKYYEKLGSLFLLSSSALSSDVARMKEVIENYNQTQEELRSGQIKQIIINDIIFWYTPDIIITQELISQLEAFSCTASEDSYGIYFEGNNLVIY